MTLVLTVPGGVPNQLVSLLDESKTPLRGQVAEFDLPSCIAVAGFTTPDIIAALAAGTNEVCFPPGTYDVTAPITQSIDHQVLNFQPGAALRFAASGLGQLAINGVNAKIVGEMSCRWEAPSAVAYVAIDLHGQGSSIDRADFSLTAEVQNCTPLRMSGDYTNFGVISFSGAGGSFKYGVEISRQDGTAAQYVRAGRMVWQMANLPVPANANSAWLRMRCTRSVAGPFNIINGAGNFFNSIIEDDGTSNSLEDPVIFSSGCNYAVLMKDNAEFLQINGGQLFGNFRAGSVGIQCGDGSLVVNPATGQLKCYGTKIINWEINCRLTGSSDTPEFFGCTISNASVANVQIDSQRGASVWPVSGLGFFGCYCEEAAVPGVPFLHLKSGSLMGGICTGSEIGYTGTAVQVEAAMSTNEMEFYGNRFPGAGGGGAAVTTPNANSLFYFGPNLRDGVTAVGRGAFADKAILALDPILSGIVVGVKGAGTANNHRVRQDTDIYTANFGNIAPGATATLNLGYATLPSLTTGAFRTTMDSSLGAKASVGIVFQWWINSSSNIGASATNTSLVTVNGVTGGVRFEPVVYG